MIEIAEQIPDARVWLDADRQVTTRELADEGPCLFLFYLFDWTGT